MAPMISIRHTATFGALSLASALVVEVKALGKKEKVGEVLDCIA